MKKLIGALIAIVAIVIGAFNGASDLLASDSDCRAKLSQGEQIEWNTVRQEVVITAPADQKWTARAGDKWVWFDYEDYHYYTKGQGNGSVTL